MTADVHHTPRLELDQLLEKVFGATFARWVNDDGRGLCIHVSYLLEDILSVSHAKFGVLEAVKLGVVGGCLTHGLRHFDAVNLLEQVGRCYSKQA